MSKIGIPSDGGYASFDDERQRHQNYEEECRREAERFRGLSVPELVERLRHMSFFCGCRQTAIERALVAMPEATLAAAAQHLEEPENVSWTFMSALAGIGTQALPVLSRVLRRGKPYARRCACNALGGIEAREATDLLIKATADSSPIVRSAAATMLRFHASDPRTLAAVRRALHDVPSVRSAAADTIEYRRGLLFDLDVTEQVLFVIGLGHDFNRRYAAEKLPRTAYPVLIRLAREGDAVARQRGIEILGFLGEDAPVLMEALGFREKRVRMAAIVALARVHSEAISPALGRAEIEPMRWRMLVTIDEAKEPAAPLVRAGHAPTAGAVLRLWNRRRSTWQGGWSEVLIVGEEFAALRTLDDPHRVRAYPLGTLANDAWHHPDPARLLTLAAEREAGLMRYRFRPTL